MKKFLLFFFVIHYLLLTYSIHTLEHVIVKEKKLYFPGLYMEILKDPDKKFTIEDVSSEKNEYLFEISKKRRPNFAYTKSVFWIKIILYNRIINSKELYFIFDHPTLDKIDCYIPADPEKNYGESWIIKKSGDCYPITEREIKNRNHVFRIPIVFDEQKTIYFKIETTSTMTFPCIIMTHDAFETNSYYEQFYFGLYYGIIIIMVLYHIILSIFLRDKTYLLYSVYVFLTGIFLFSLNGFTSEYFSAVNIWLSHIMSTLSAALASAAAIIFARFFLKFKEWSKTMNIIALIFIFLSLFTAISVFFPDYSFSTILLNYVVLCAGVCGMVFGIIIWCKGYHPAKYWLLAFTVLELGVIIYSLRNFSFLAKIIPDNIITKNGIQIGFMLQIILLSIGLADRINLIRHEKEIAQEQAIKNLHDVNIMKDHFLQKIELLNKNLEEKVEERNKELIEANKNLEKTNLKLESLDKLKNDFIANITHDFRSPLMVIQNISDLALKYNNDLDEDLSDSFKIIYESSGRLKIYIDRLLELAKMDATGVKLKINKFDLNKFINEITDFYRSAAASINIKIIYKDPGKKINIYCDEEKLEEILNNLISNAVKFVDSENGEIIINLSETKTNVDIIIQDNGIGIPQKNLESIFTRFNHLGTDRNTKYRGTGIGLAFSKELAEYLNGSIKAFSDGPGKGSKFVVTLKKGSNHFSKKLIQKDKQSLTEIKHKIRNDYHLMIKSDIKMNAGSTFSARITNPNNENEFDINKAKILIVEDNIEIQKIEIRYLENAGFQNFVQAFNGEEAIEACYKFKPDIILCDYYMPKIRGDQFHDELIENPDFKLIPFIFLTAIADRNIDFERKKKGAIAYLNKPIDEEELILTIELHLKKYFEFKKNLINASTDTLTGLNNKRNTYNILKKIILMREYRDFSIVLMDLDNFKQINDNHGYKTGDILLKAVGGKIRDIIKNYDTAGRYGSDKFIIALPDANVQKAIIATEKLLNAVNNIEINYNDHLIKITSSFGISSLKNNEKYICEKLNIANLHDIFEIEYNEAVDSDYIENMKYKILDLLISMSFEALRTAKTTVCNNCKYSSLKAENFTDNTCPNCKSSDISPGRNKISTFS